MMQPRPRPTRSRASGRATAEQRSLAVVHAAALYRPIPPVECDEDGYPFSDAKPMSEGDYHGDVLDYPATGEMLPGHVESEAMRAREAASRAAAESRAVAAEAQVITVKERLPEETAAREAAERRIEELERRLRGSASR